MKRFIDQYLLEWKEQKSFKPLLLRGARQVGKTYAVRKLGKTFDSFIELNLEFRPEIQNLFTPDLDPHRIIRDISLITEKNVIPGRTLLFFDEVQAAPQAIQALRYFYEMIPDLHVIAAGSLLDFAIELVGMPVGRVQTLYMYPLSFLEFINGLQKKNLLELLMNHAGHQPLPPIAHTQLLTLLGEYLAIGGMPEVVLSWSEHRDPLACFALHQTLINAYRQDFGKYSKKFQIKYLEILFDSIPLYLGKQFKYTSIAGDYRKRELAPCLDLLVTAGIITKAFHTDAQGLPLGAQVDLNEFKCIFLDVALAQATLGLDLGGWFLSKEQQFINKGEIVEAFIGQELLAYANPLQKKPLYYWHRTERSSQAEIDYVAIIDENITPIEVKSGSGTSLKSMHLFLETHPNSSFGIKFSTQNYSIFEKIHAYPLYAVAQALKSKLPPIF